MSNRRKYPFVSFYSMRYTIVLIKKLLKKLQTKENSEDISNIIFFLDEQWRYVKRLQKWFDDNIDIFQSEEDKQLLKMIDQYRQELKKQGLDFDEMNRIGKMCRDLEKFLPKFNQQTIVTTSGIEISDFNLDIITSTDVKIF